MTAHTHAQMSTRVTSFSTSWFFEQATHSITLGIAQVWVCCRYPQETCKKHIIYIMKASGLTIPLVMLTSHKSSDGVYFLCLVLNWCIISCFLGHLTPMESKSNLEFMLKLSASITIMSFLASVQHRRPIPMNMHSTLAIFMCSNAGKYYRFFFIWLLVPTKGMQGLLFVLRV